MLLVYGPRSLDYDFGPGHPLTPRRFGPSIDLLRELGATPGLAPEPAPDEELRWCHEQDYIDVVRRFSDDPSGGYPEAGIGGTDNPAFLGMHEAGAAVAGGSIRAMEAILRGDVEHAQHPGGGLHHAMADRASGFCIYDDPALAIARCRRDGLRVLYVDVDVHHGDGVQRLFYADPGVLTLSVHELWWTFFPGTGTVDEIGAGPAAGTSVNVPLSPLTGERAWSTAIGTLLPELAAAFGPDVIVSQHGADSHAWDPLAHLNVTTTAMGEVARLVDRLAHLHAGGRWLATNGGGYDAYRVVPRAWALTWLAGEHREVPDELPAAWRDRWSEEAARFGQTPLPERFIDAPNAGLPQDADQEASDARAVATTGLVRRVLVPRLLREATDRGWWDPLASPTPAMPASAEPGVGAPAVLPVVEPHVWARLTLAPWVISPADPGTSHAIVAAAIGDRARVSAAIEGTTVVGLAVSRWADDAPRDDLLALGVAPAWRRQGLGGRLLEANLSAVRPHDVEHVAEITLADRDWRVPLDHERRATVGRQILERAGYRVGPADELVRAVDPFAIDARRP
jgi:acetoin utilization protein AcuC